MIENRSGLPHAWFRKAGPAATAFDVVALRGTFRIDTDKSCLLPADAPGEIVYGDEFIGVSESDPLGGVIRREGDLVLYKPATDIHVVGTARAESGKALPRWYAGIAIANVQKVLQLCGPRMFELGVWDWRLTAPEPIDAVALDYRLAFGGRFHAPAEEAADDEWLYKRDNPAGCGWLPNKEKRSQLSKAARRQVEDAIYALRRMPAPQIEDPRAPVEHPERELPVQGFGPMARWCAPRVDFQGTRDAAWRAQNYPALPADFDPRFFQSAHPDLICAAHLAGDETLTLSGLLPEGRVSFALPSCRPFAVAVLNDGSRVLSQPVLDTVCVDLDRREVALTWRTSFTASNPVRHLVLGKEAAP